MSFKTVRGLSSNVWALNPLLSSASAIAAPVRRDTSASLEGPPINTIIFLSFIVSLPPI